MPSTNNPGVHTLESMYLCPSFGGFILPLVAGMWPHFPNLREILSLGFGRFSIFFRISPVVTSHLLLFLQEYVFWIFTFTIVSYPIISELV